MLEYFDGCTAVIVPDNLKSGVSKACRYDPDLNPSYQQWAEHYGVAIILARPFKPKDKSKAEVAVQVVERWILARLRHQTFFSLAEINQRIRALLEHLNNRSFKLLPGCRQSAFEQLDKPALRSLPAQPYRYVAIKPVKVNIDYHVQYEQHSYSVPHQYVGEKTRIACRRDTDRSLLPAATGASHPRQYTPGLPPIRLTCRRATGRSSNGHRTVETLGERHRPGRLAWVSSQLASRPHPEQAYKVCLGLLNLSKQYPTTRLNAAVASPTRPA